MRVAAYRPRVTDHEILVMTRLADLYATLAPDARHRVHDYMGTRLDGLPVTNVGEASRDDDPQLPFGRDGDDGQAA